MYEPIWKRKRVKGEEDISGSVSKKISSHYRREKGNNKLTI